MRSSKGSHLRAKKIAMWGAPLFLALAGAGYAWYAQAAERVMQEFVTAVEKKDFKTIHRLASPKEKKELNVTLQTLPIAFDRLLYRHGAVKAIKNQYRGEAGPKRDNKVWDVFWGNATSGQPLSGKNATGQLFCDVIVHPTAKGWRVNVTHFLYSGCLYQWGRQKQWGKGSGVFSQSGIKGILHEDGTVFLLSTVLR